MTTAPSRGAQVIWWGAVSLLVALSGLGGLARPAAAQKASPVASPVATASGVRCTTLFGIVDETASCVLLINASPDAGFVDVHIDGALAVPGVEFAILGDFIPVPSEERRVQIVTAGGDPEGAAIDETIAVAPGVAYEVAAVGLIAESRLLTRAVNTAPFAGEVARIQVVHAAPDAPAIDLAVPGGQVFAANLPYLGLSDEVEVPAGTYALAVLPAGEDEVIVSLGDTLLKPNVNYTFYVIGRLADNTIGGFAVPVAVPSAAVEAAATPVP